MTRGGRGGRQTCRHEGKEQTTTLANKKVRECSFFCNFLLKNGDSLFHCPKKEIRVSPSSPGGVCTSLYFFCCMTWNNNHHCKIELSTMSTLTHTNTHMKNGAISSCRFFIFVSLHKKKKGNNKRWLLLKNHQLLSIVPIDEKVPPQQQNQVVSPPII